MAENLDNMKLTNKFFLVYECLVKFLTALISIQFSSIYYDIIFYVVI